MDFSAFAHLPHNQAAENNKSVICQRLTELGLFDNCRVLELGSGTGQHGIYFCYQAKQLNKQLSWQLTETSNQLPLLDAFYQIATELGLNNLISPQLYQIADNPIPAGNYDYVYSANVLHIVSPELAQRLIEDVTDILCPSKRLVCYGPFKVANKFTTTSNEQFNDWLLSEGYGGIRDIQELLDWSEGQLELEFKIDMPANNFLLVFRKKDV